MKIYNILSLVNRNSVLSKLQLLAKRSHFQCISVLKNLEDNAHKRLSLVATSIGQKHRKIHEITTDNDELIDLDIETEMDLEASSHTIEQKYSKNLLYNNTFDPVIEDLKTSASIQDVLTLYGKNKNRFSHKHLVQSILVLSDLRKIYTQVAVTSPESDFIKRLRENKEFQQILLSLEKTLPILNNLETIYLLQHLNMLGIDICDPLLQMLIKNVKSNLMNKFSLSEAAIFFTIIFKDASLRPFLVVQELVPFVIERIDRCSFEEFENLTLCLNKIQRIVTNEAIQKYKEKVINFIENGDLLPTNKTTILQIISFLGTPAWRDDSTHLLGKCMLLLQGHLNTLNPDQLVLFYDIFFKTKEPGDLLNEIQRCARAYLYNNIDDVTYCPDIQLKIFLSLLCFLSPLQRCKYQEACRKYVYYSKDYNKESLLALAKILSYIRTSDNNLCEILWKNMAYQVKHTESEFTIFRICQNYINFHTDVNNYRYPQFENYCMLQLKNKFLNGFIQCIPARVSNILAFSMIYGKDKEFLEMLITKLEENWEQINSIQCLILSQSIKIINTTPNRYFSRFHLHRLHTVIDKATEKELASLNNSRKKASWLLKACVLRKAREDLSMRLLQYINDIKVVSSRNIENLTYCLLKTNIMHKEVLNQCIYYVIDNEKHILGYEAQRLLYLCYHFGYQHENLNQFLQVIINLILRDQERLTGLTLLQTALALCFYNKLPLSFIKLIMTVDFVEKLEEELKNCYSKDKYPQRVRNKLMQVNRAVCLQYPEANVPWLHEKYIEVVKNEVVQDLEKQKMFPNRVKTYLAQVLKKPEYINEHVITPYGYHIDFELNLNHESKLVKPGSTDTKRKLAVLLIKPNAFTKFEVQLKGKYQLMKRHLEILGYEVIFINFSDWMNLVYAGERLEFLSDLIWPKKYNIDCVVTDR